MDFVTQGLAGDPFKEGSEKSSWGGKAGMLLAAAPITPKLPVISPEAYQDVKAGGLRLYSRLTDAFAKAPSMMKPAKAISIAQSGASKEEIGLRKLGEFLKSKQPMQDVPREEIMGHLAQNPLELDVVRKSGKELPADEYHRIYDEAQRNRDRILHELETEYGPGFNYDQLTPFHLDNLRAAEQRLQDAHRELNTGVGGGNTTRWDQLQTPGPKENYGESLINLPSAHGNDVQAMPSKALGNTFVSSHWDEPNNLVWSRHNDRNLKDFGSDPDSGAVLGPNTPGGSKGRFVEEIQSDWHQQGRERGYKGDPYPEIFTQPVAVDRDGNPVSWDAHSPASKHLINAGSPEDATEQLKGLIDRERVPDAPFKDTYHELALKQQLLDAANDPSLEWLGVADADTVSAMEGHSEIRPGTELYYNEKHPSALEKLLKPMGGKVQLDELPGIKPHEIAPAQPNDNRVLVTAYTGDHPAQHTMASVVQRPDEGTVGQAWYEGHDIAHQMKEEGRLVPGPRMWKANLPPELKELIKTRGFPAMTALLALQQSVGQNRPDE